MKTIHFEKRMFQRRLNAEKIRLVLRYGERIYASHTLYYFMSRKVLKKLSLDPHLKEKLDGVTLVVDPRNFSMITCFRNPQFRRKIKKS